ncbi:KTSC domain-containing protein [Nocardioides sp.]|uniref:KTSC domain-containing protein n=1 Tax=Nocardioides sp. TaxID=35761 RepID=UPI0039E2FCCF
MEMVPMRHSKALAEMGYDDARNVLRVRFRHGGLYAYFAVPRSIYEALLTDPHPWTNYRDEILSHPYQRLEA